MKRKRPAYLLLPTLIIISGLSLVFVVQHRVFGQRIQTTKLVNQSLLIDTVQLRASIAYYENHSLTGQYEEAHYSIAEKEQEIHIRWHSKEFKRKLF